MAEPIRDRRPPTWRFADALGSGTGVILIFAAVLVLLIGGIWLLLRGQGADDVQRWGDHAPKWSPDGRRIAFESPRNDPHGHRDTIYAINADGSGEHALTPAREDAELPHWSPDGKRIVYVQGQIEYDQYGEAVYGGNGKIVIMRADGTGKHAIAASGSTTELSWSPDGHWIAFEADIHEPDLDSRSSVQIVHPDGTGLQTVARDAYSPAWSPDGKLLAFSTGSNGLLANHTVDVVRVASGRRIHVTAPSSAMIWPIVWSPDGSKVVFISGDVAISSEAPNAGVYVVNADGSGGGRPISGPDNLDDINLEHGLAWVPGSRDEVVYYGSQGAFLTSTKGGSERVLDDEACCAAEPSPDGRKIAFSEFSNGSIMVAPISGGAKTRLTQTTE